jgi:DnaK suppressor protein
MDDDRARQLLVAERSRIQSLLEESTVSGLADRDAEAEPGDMSDAAQPLESEGVDDAVAASLLARLEAVDRAEQRISDGTFGVSVESGEAIPDARLENDPTAELTVEEAAAHETHG